MPFPLTVKVRRSRILDRALIAVVLAGLFAVCVVPWVPTLRASLAVAFVLAGVVAYRALTPRVVGLSIGEDGNIACQVPGSGGFVEVHLMHRTTAHPWLTVVRLAGTNFRVTAVLAPDAADADALRYLRVWLRWRAQFNDAAGGS